MKARKQKIYSKATNVDELTAVLIEKHQLQNYTPPLTYELQEKQLDVVKECREQVDTQHPKWFKEVVDFAKTINVVPCVKRIAGQQTL